MKTIICTTGTSIASGVPLDRIDKSTIEKRLKDLRGDPNTGHYLVQASAESHSLFRMNLDPADTVHLLHTQTEEGKVCADALKSLISDSEALGQKVQLHEVHGLQVEDRDRFRREGIDNLFKRLDELSKPHLDRGQHDVWLNVTGGFKSVVPYVTLFGLLYRLPVVYIFERSETLITLPPAAINFDFERLAQIDGAIRRLTEEGPMPKDEFFKEIPNLDHSKREWISTLLEEEDGLVTLSAFGFLASRVINQEIPSIKLSPNALKAYNNAGGDVRRRFTVMLVRVSDPIWRTQKRHPFDRTDLTVFKPGNTSERMAGFVDNDEVYVCELYQHDQYERELPGRNKADYPLGSFRPWGRPADQQALPRTEEEEYRQLEDDLKASNELLEECQQKLERTNSERRAHEDKLHGQIGELRKRCDQLDRANSEHEFREEELHRQVEEWRSRYDQLDRANSEHESREEELHGQVEEWRKRSNQLELELKQYKSRVPWWKRMFRL